MPCRYTGQDKAQKGPSQLSEDNEMEQDAFVDWAAKLGGIAQPEEEDARISRGIQEYRLKRATMKPVTAASTEFGTVFLALATAAAQVGSTSSSTALREAVSRELGTEVSEELPASSFAIVLEAASRVLNVSDCTRKLPLCEHAT